ncbi:MAG TPA: CehA/McbA family metallohydrolase [Candidatus Lokiarchaeia archaeon]|nr:CehA/McbA family metallohydrolase [Candidatus Lokiarchaeia archaeon]
MAFIIFLMLLITRSSSEKMRGHIPNEAFNYSFRPDFIPKDAYLIDLHSHTIASDGFMTPEQNILWHKANGFNAFALTDHNTGANNGTLLALQEKYPDMVLIPGYEWTITRVHLNFLGITDFSGNVPNLSKDDEDVKFAIAKAKELGAIVQVDHITWTEDQPHLRTGEFLHPTRDQLLDWGVDGFEIYNEMRWADPNTIYWLENLRATGELPRTVYLSTGTDIHSPLKEWATCWTELLLTHEEREQPSWEIIKQALLEGRTRIWSDQDYRRPPEMKYQAGNDYSKKKRILAPFYGLKDMFGNAPGGISGIAWDIVCLVLLYFPLRFLFLWLFSF